MRFFFVIIRVVCILSGGNVDTTVLARTIERGLAEEGRLIKADVFIKDAAGHISKLLDLVGNIGVNVKHIIQERSWIFDDVHSVKVRKALFFYFLTIQTELASL